MTGPQPTPSEYLPCCADCNGCPACEPELESVEQPTPSAGDVEALEGDAVLAECAEAVANALADRPQRCGHSSDPMCCPYENFPALAAFFVQAARDDERARVRHAHIGCARRMDGDIVHYECGISVKRGEYDGGVYAEHVRQAEARGGGR
jgi:hypothetical protein